MDRIELLARMLGVEETTDKRTTRVVLGDGGKRFRLDDVIEGIGHRLSALDSIAQAQGARGAEMKMSAVLTHVKRLVADAKKREERLKKRIKALEAKRKR